MVSLEFDEPAEEEFKATVSLDPKTGNLVGSVTATVRITRSCAECSSEMKEASLDLEHDGEVILSGELLTAEGSPWPGGHIRFNESTEMYEWLDGHGIAEIKHDDPKQIEAGRRAKSFGASIDWRVDCTCSDCLADGQLEAKVTASEMDDL